MCFGTELETFPLFAPCIKPRDFSIRTHALRLKIVWHLGGPRVDNVG